MSPHDIEDVLLSCTLFESLSRALITECAAHCSLAHRAEAEQLCAQGAYANDLYLLAEGSIRVYAHLKNGEELTLQQLTRRGSFVGEHGWWSEENVTRTRSAVFSLDSQVVIVPRRVARLIKAKQPSFFQELERLRSAQSVNRLY